MLNFHVDLAGHDKVSDQWRRQGYHVQAQIQSPFITTKNLQKMKNLPKTWVSTGKQFEDFRQKNF